MKDERADAGLGIEGLLKLPVTRAAEFARWGVSQDGKSEPAPEPSGPFGCEREYLFCKAVVENPLQASSTYPKLAGMSSKTAQEVRKSLVADGFILERVFESGGRGRATLLLEATPAGKAAVEKYVAGWKE